MSLAWRLALLAAGLAGGCAAVPAAGDPAAIAKATPTPQAAPAPTQPGPIALVGELTQGGFARGRVPVGTARLTLDGETVPLADDGGFLVAFDRDAGPAALLVTESAAGRRAEQALAIAPRAWRIERVDTPKSTGGSSDMTIRGPELARIAAARAQVTGAQGWRQRFAWPVRGRISGLFGAQRIYRGGEAGSYHSGLDIAPGEGVTYSAPADGVVVLAAERPFSLEGYLLIVDHGGGLSSAFLHSRRLLVREGDAVRQGQPLGEVGMSGRATGPHLHWGLVWRGRRLDPLLFAGPMG